jgi:hypothetical protein
MRDGNPMSDRGSADRPVVVALTGRRGRHAGAVPDADAPVRRAHPSEATTLYAMAARLAELQLELAEQGSRDDPELAATRDALRATHRIACAGMDLPEPPGSTARPALRLVPPGEARD